MFLQTWEGLAGHFTLIANQFINSRSLVIQMLGIIMLSGSTGWPTHFITEIAGEIMLDKWWNCVVSMVSFMAEYTYQAWPHLSHEGDSFSVLLGERDHILHIFTIMLQFSAFNPVVLESAMVTITHSLPGLHKHSIFPKISKDHISEDACYCFWEAQYSKIVLHHLTPRLNGSTTPPGSLYWQGVTLLHAAILNHIQNMTIPEQLFLLHANSNVFCCSWKPSNRIFPQHSIRSKVLPGAKSNIDFF